MAKTEDQKAAEKAAKEAEKAAKAEAKAKADAEAAAAKEAEKAAEEAAKAAEKAAKEAAKAAKEGGPITVEFIELGQTKRRTYSLEDHGENYADLAKQFCETHAAKKARIV